MFCKKKLCRRCDAWADALLWWSCQSPVAHSCGLLNHPNSFHGGMFKLNTKSDAHSLLCSLSQFECLSTQYTRSLNGLYWTHWLVQWSRRCSHMRIPVHCPGLSVYIDVVQRFLVKHQITQVTQPPYSPDFVPCDFWLFPKLKSPLKGKRFRGVIEIQENTTGKLMVIGRTVWGPKVPTLKETEVSFSCVQCFFYVLQ